MERLIDYKGQGSYLIANVMVVDPEEKKLFPGFVAVENGKLKGVEEGRAPDGGLPVFDGEGLFLSPGFVDIHVHLREPGFEHKEDITSGTRAAVAGGFTAVACMPNTEPAVDDKSVVDFIVAKAKVADWARVYPVAAATVGRKGEKLCEYNRLVSAGAVAVSDDGAPIRTAQVLRRVLEYASLFGLPVIEHCEDPSTSVGVMNEGYYSTKLGLRGTPAFSEQVCLARDLLVLQAARSRLHLAHLSTAGSVALVREAKERGLPVTAETAPHYFSLEEKELESYDTNLKVNPPLRSAEDREAIIKGLKDGTIDCIATDHAPHAAEEKQVEFDLAPSGAVGLETALGVVVKYLVEPGHLDLVRAVSLLTVGPAAALNLPEGTWRKGRLADMVLFDPEEEWIVEEKLLKSKSKNSPFLGRKLKGRVKFTVVRGRLVQVATLR